MMRLVAKRSDNNPKRYQYPSGFGFAKLIQILNHFVIRRPESTIDLPPLTKTVVRFKLNEEEEEESNECFRKYQAAIQIASSERPKDQDPGTAFKSLTHALQHACHPQLVDLMQFVRSEGQGKKTDEEDDVLHNPATIAHWIKWRDNLKENESWRSSRIDALIDVFNKHRDLDPSCSFVVFDESVYFLDVVQIALENTYEPIKCLRYDGRTPSEKRDEILQEFQGCNGSKVLLMTRGAGGIGLNLPFANIVIQCAPWWKTEWEEQAYKRVWRPGQLRSVTYIVLQAEWCKAEAYKARARDRKHKFNTKVINAITRKDGERPQVRDDFK